MIRANIKSAEDALIGTINEEGNGFRIWWRKRMENHPRNIHSVENKLYPTFEEACQGVYRVVQDARITEA